jgi:hypothetical protein
MGTRMHADEEGVRERHFFALFPLQLSAFIRVTSRPFAVYFPFIRGQKGWHLFTD